MLSNRTANFKVNEEPGNLKITTKDILVKQLTTPLPKFDMNFNFSNEDDRETSSFSFKNDLLDKKAYEFIKSKDECLAIMELDDSLPNKNEESKIDEKENNEAKKKL